MKVCLATVLLALSFSALAAQPRSSDFAACQSGMSQAHTVVTEIPFQTLTEEDDYWKGYTATTVQFKGKSVGYARKGEAQGVAFNGRVYPIAQAEVVNMPQAEFDDQLRRGSIGVIQPADWYWLKGTQQYVCIATNRSMEKGTPALFLLSTGKNKHLYVAWGTTPH